MNKKSYQAITAMLNAFPQSQADIRGLLLTYEQALSGISEQAIEETAMRFIRGDIPDQNKTFAPSIAEFVDATRRQQEIIGMRSRPRLEGPKFPTFGKSSPWERNVAKARAAHAHLPVLFEDVSYDQWRKLSATREIPVGAKWVACLATVYGPEPKRSVAAAE